MYEGKKKSSQTFKAREPGVRYRVRVGKSPIITGVYKCAVIMEWAIQSINQSLEKAENAIPPTASPQKISND